MKPGSYAEGVVVKGSSKDGLKIIGLGKSPAKTVLLLYGESLWFDTTKARRELDWRAKHSNAAMVVESYEWFLAHRGELGDGHGSHHQSPVKTGALGVLKRLP